jgi:GT2 family glycosyltransferase
MFSIIILNYNSTNETRLCISSIFSHCNNSSLFEIIVVDNNSNERDIESIKNYFPEKENIKLLLLDKNNGYGSGNNAAMKIASYPFFLILNPDTRFLSNPLPLIEDFFSSHSQAGVLGAALRNEQGFYQHSFGYFSDTTCRLMLDFLDSSLISKVKEKYRLTKMLHSSNAIEFDWVLGAFLCVRRIVFEEVGGFDEHFFLYFEENDWCRSIKSVGWKVFVLPKIQVLHYGSKITQRNFEFYYRVLYESRLLYIDKHYSFIISVWMKFVSMIGIFFRLLYNLPFSHKQSYREKVKGFISAFYLHFK